MGSGTYGSQGWMALGGTASDFYFGGNPLETNNGNPIFNTGTFTFTSGPANSVTTGDGHTTVVQGQGTGSSAYKPTGENPPYNSDSESDGGSFWSNLGDGIKSLWQTVMDFIDAGMKIAESIMDSFLQQSNKDCAQPIMDKIYHNGCYACKIMKSLLSEFLRGCSMLEKVAQEAGIKILLIGTMLWIAFYIMKQVSSLKNIEPGAMINDLLIMMFKILGAYLAIKIGFKLAIDFVLVPFISWGAEFGSTLAQSIATKLEVSVVNQAAAEDMVTSPEGFLPAKFLNDIVTLVSSIDGVTSQHMKLGHMLICHSTHAGSWYVMPNFWTMLCGVLIWCAGFFMTLSIVFFLVDISFKLSLSLIALPIVTGLWPFGVTGDRFVACIKIILNAAGILIFLALTTSVAMILVDKALTVNSEGGIAELYKAIEDGDTDLISSKISLMSVGFILLIFSYFYGLKVIGATVNEYVQTFFPDGVLGGQTPMHDRMVGKLAMIKTQANRIVSFGEDVVKHQASQGLENGARGLGKFVRKSVRKIVKGGSDGGGSGSGGGSGGGGSGNVAGTGLKAGGKAASTAGSGMKVAGSGMKASGQAVEAGTKAAATGIKAAGSGVAAAGDALAPVTFGASAVVGHAVQAGAQAGATGIEAAGKAAGEALKKSGEAVKQAGEAVKQTGKTMEQAGKMMDQTSQRSKSKSSGGDDDN